MHIAELWRYPIKSMRGERLQQATISPQGIPGDREIVVFSQAGQVLTSRRYPRLLGLQGSIAPDGVPTVNGNPWDSEAARRLADEATGQKTTLLRIAGTERFDVLPLLVATDGAIHHLALDGRRLRPNILIGGVEGLAERDWPGKIIAIGGVRVHAAQLRQRCVMTTYDPDTLAQDRSVLVRIVRELGGTIALDCSVLVPGTIRVGDAVEILASSAAPASGR